MNLVNKPPYMGLNCINRLLFATTLLCELASQKISLKCNTLNLFQAFATLKKKLSKTNALVVNWLISWYIPAGIMNLWGYTEILADLFKAESQLTVDKTKTFHPLM